MERQPHILVVDDDREIRTLLARFLGDHGFRVSEAHDARKAQQVLKSTNVDLVILDLMLPGEDGLSFCRKLRADGTMPVVMLTALAGDADRIVGLELGADDYVTKPFNPRELVARVKAVLRRSEGAGHAGPRPARRVGFAGWSLDLVSRELQSPDGVVVQLSAGEFDLLRAFVENPQKVLNRDQLLDIARGRSAAPFDRSIDVQVSRLRRKIEPDPEKPTLIKTVRNGGYLFTAEVAPLAAERGA
ncbi:MAG: response regulator [Alphaproteobacteria bacterium]|nr:response regulator [Alphaproteobacteria bacterium]